MTRPTTIALLVASALLAHASAAAQDARSIAEKVYAETSGSVVLIETRDGNNEPTGQATAFVVAPNLLLTNAHAVGGAAVWVRLGPVAVPATIERTDAFNDLALLRVTAETDFRPLPFSTSTPRPGARVFALGNPKGLVGTITEGLLTGIRDIDGRALFQVSAALSRGSSGGPVLNERGEVVGVAVAMLRDAGNIGFAVPAAAAVKLLLDEAAAPLDVANGSRRVRNLLAQRMQEDYSELRTSRYQTLTSEIKTLVGTLLPVVTSQALLAQLFEDLALWEPELAREVARRAVALSPASAPALRNLAGATRTVAAFEADAAARAALYREAEPVAVRAVAASAPGERREALLLLGEIRSELPDRRELAIASLRDAIADATDETAHAAWLTLFDLYYTMGRFLDARLAFDAARAIAESPRGPRDGTYGHVLEGLGEYRGAAAAYLQAAGSSYARACDAARALWLAGTASDAIGAARRCLEEAAADDEGEPHAAYAHRLLSHMLLGRGVVDGAINHARQAIALAPHDGLAFSALTSALLKAERWSEAESSARSAIRLTDGAHSAMHFALGAALFNQERWSEARSAFEQSATMNDKDAASAYNVGLSLLRLRFHGEALVWLREALRRDPHFAGAAAIRKQIATLQAD